MSIKPKQRLRRAAKDRQWGIDNAEYFKGNCSDAVIDTAIVQRNYRAAGGNLIEEDYIAVLNPTNSKKKNLNSYPARIRNYDILSPVFLRMLSEYGEREFGVLVYAKNSNIDQVKIEAEQVELLRSLQMQFNNELLANGIDTGFPEEELPSYEDIKKKTEGIKDEMSIQGQTAIDYLENILKLPMKYRQGFYHWLCTARVFTYKSIHRNEPNIEVVFPGEIKYLAGRDIDFIGEAEAVTRTFGMTINEILDLFQHKLKEEKQFDIIEKLENVAGNRSSDKYVQQAGSDVDYRIQNENILHRNVFGDTNIDNTSMINVDHVVWRSNQLIYKYPIKVDGKEDYLELSDDFIPTEEERQFIKEEWVEEVWEAYILDDRYYTGIGPISYLTGSANNPNAVFLPYNGRVFYTPRTSPVSFIQRGLPYQFNYNLIKYRGELTFAKTKDMIITLPLGLIPDKPGWDMHKVMDYLDRDSTLWIDDSKKNAAVMVQLIKTLNTSLHQYLGAITQYAESVKQEWYEVVGFNRQRTGDIKASDGKANTQEAIFRSNLTTEEYFKQYDEFRLEEYRHLLEISKFAWINGKKAHFMHDKMMKLLEINPEMYFFSDWGMVPANSRKELEELDRLKAVVQPLAQQPEVPKRILGEILSSKNINEANKRLRVLEEDLEKKAREIQQMANESNERVAQMENETAQAERDSKQSIAQGNNTTAIQVALINASKASGSGETVEKEDPYAFIEEVQKASLQLLGSENGKMKNELEERKNIRDNDSKKYQADKQLEVAKQNKNKYDK